MVLGSGVDSGFNAILGVSGAISPSSFERQCGQCSGGNAKANRLTWNWQFRQTKTRDMLTAKTMAEVAIARPSAASRTIGLSTYPMAPNAPNWIEDCRGR